MQTGEDYREEHSKVIKVTVAYIWYYI